MCKLLDLINDYAFNQHVIVPTYLASLKTLELILSSTRTPSTCMVSDMDAYPRMRDHDIVTFNIKFSPHRTSRPPHKIHLFNRANLDGLQEHVKIISDVFMWTSNCRSQQNWSLCKEKIQSTAWSNYKRQWKRVIKVLRAAHVWYLNDVIDGSLHGNPRKFWSYLKQCHTESSGIPTLLVGIQSTFHQRTRWKHWTSSSKACLQVVMGTSLTWVNPSSPWSRTSNLLFLG